MLLNSIDLMILHILWLFDEVFRNPLVCQLILIHVIYILIELLAIPFTPIKRVDTNEEDRKQTISSAVDCNKCHSVLREQNDDEISSVILTDRAQQIEYLTNQLQQIDILISQFKQSHGTMKFEVFSDSANAKVDVITEVASLTDVIESLDLRNSELLTENELQIFAIQELRHQHKEVESSRYELLNEIKSLEDQIRGGKDFNEYIQLQLPSEVTSVSESLPTENNAKTSETANLNVDTLRSQLDDLREELAVRGNYIVQLEAEKVNLLNQQVILKEELVVHSNLAHQVSQLSILQQHSYELEKELSSQRLQTDQLTAQLRRAESNFSRTEQALQRALSDLATTQDQLNGVSEVYNRSKDSLEEELTAFRRKLQIVNSREQQLNSLISTYLTISFPLSVVDMDESEWVDILNRLEEVMITSREATELKLLNSELRDSVSTLHTDSEQYHTHVQVLELALAQARSQIESQSAQYEQLVEYLNNLHKKLIFQQKLSPLTTSEPIETSNDLNQLKYNITSLLQNLHSDLTPSSVDAEVSTSEDLHVHDLQLHLDALQIAHDQLQSQLSIQSKSLADIQYAAKIDAQQSTDRIMLLCEQLAAESTTTQEITEQSQQLQIELRNLRKAYEETESEAGDLRADLALATATVKSLGEMVEDLNRQLAQQMEARDLSIISPSKTQLDKFSESNSPSGMSDGSQHTSSSLGNRGEALSLTLSRLTSTLANKSDAISRLEQQVFDISSEVDTLRLSLESRDDTIRQVETQLQVTSQQLENLTHEYATLTTNSNTMVNTLRQESLNYCSQIIELEAEKKHNQTLIVSLNAQLQEFTQRGVFIDMFYIVCK